MNKCSPEEAIATNDHIIDVRSPKEFQHSHIPQAINVPILDDYSHKEVGTVYRQMGKEAAITRGLELTHPVLGEIYRRLDQLPGRLILYCDRGGMRSQSIAHLLQAFGRDVCIIDGGYKAYRELVLRRMAEEVRRRTFVVLQGNTGVGKTKILQALEGEGYGILDLEDLAHHAGSVFGHIAFSGDQPSQKQFENVLFQRLLELPSIVLSERESRKIGRLHLPDSLYRSIAHAKHILLSTSMENRVTTILEDYHPEWKVHLPQLKEAIDQLKVRLSTAVTEELKRSIEQEDFEPVIRYLMEHYYDPLYQRSLKQQDNDYILKCHFETREEAIEQIKNIINHLS